MRKSFWIPMAALLLMVGPALANCGKCGAAEGHAAGAMKGHGHHSHDDAMTCPVDGAKVENMNLHGSYEGRDYYFHAEACLAAFEKDPLEYATAVCPVMGHPIKIKDAAAKSEFDGKTWYFCSADMKKQFDEAPEKYATFTCPVAGEMLTYAEAGAMSEYMGETVRFCCGKCKAAFEKEPAKYIKQAKAEMMHEESDHARYH